MFGLFFPIVVLLDHLKLFCML